jgi:hypothetical protein
MKLIDEDELKNLLPVKGQESTLKRLAEDGKVTLTSSQEMMKARILYTNDGLSSTDISIKTGIPVSLIERWAYLFDWEKFKRERLIPNTEKQYEHTILGDLEYRPDKILYGIESVLEQKLLDHLDNKAPLNLVELKLMASTLREVYSTRKNFRPGASSKPDQVIHSHNFDVLTNIGNAIKDKKEAKLDKSKRVTVATAIDNEYEEAAG